MKKRIASTFIFCFVLLVCCWAGNKPSQRIDLRYNSRGIKTPTYALPVSAFLESNNNVTLFFYKVLDEVQISIVSDTTGDIIYNNIVNIVEEDTSIVIPSQGLPDGNYTITLLTLYREICGDFVIESFTE